MISERIWVYQVLAIVKNEKIEQAKVLIKTDMVVLGMTSPGSPVTDLTGLRNWFRHTGEIATIT